MRNGDVEGVILIAKEGQMGDVEIKLADTAAGFLAKQLIERSRRSEHFHP